jgi:TIR domain
MADIFLSYAREDRDRARIIARLLESGGWTVFWDANIKASAEWRRARVPTGQRRRRDRALVARVGREQLGHRGGGARTFPADLGPDR